LLAPMDAMMTIRPMAPADWPMVSAIYQQGIATGSATFETQVPSYDQWNKAHLATCRFTALMGAEVAGWAALSPVSSRCVYGGVAEVSVYIAEPFRKMGVGRALMQALIQGSEQEGYWTLQSGIFPENKGSITLHEAMGFRYIGKRERVAKLHGIWKDNVLYERRSTVVGVD
jgi:L-amino acid N-acyltransferase YncA